MRWKGAPYRPPLAALVSLALKIIVNFCRYCGLSLSGGLTTELQANPLHFYFRQGEELRLAFSSVCEGVGP